VNSGEVSHVVVADNRDGMASWLSRYPAEKVSGRRLDVADREGVAALIREADVVVEALPASFALHLGKLAAECGTSLVSSMYYLSPGEEDAERIERIRGEIEELDRKAKEKGLAILSEFGLDPGLDLVLGAMAIGELDEVHEFYTYGAGLPAPPAQANPLHYKFSWSPLGVMQSYRRPARIVTGGKPVLIAADRVFEARHGHTIRVEEMGGLLECFPNGDSLHYAELLGIRDSLKEAGRYTCRLPGHCAFWDTMVKCGFLDERGVLVDGVPVSPIAFTAALLASQHQFQYADDEEDMTFLRVDARGIRRGRRMQVAWQLIDRRDLAAGFTSMQRTVGFTMSFAARLILRGELKAGLLTALDVPYDRVIAGLERHGIRLVRQVSE